MTRKTLERRSFLIGSVTVPALSISANRSLAGEEDVFSYPITRTDEEWRERLSPIEHYVLREGGTEAQRSSPLWNATEPGTYSCKGCDLTVYDSLHKIVLKKGWAFFRHSRKDTVMTGLDLGRGMMGDPFAEMRAAMEVHCRRCGSHLGHIVALSEVPNRPIHCINGFGLRFEAAAT